MTRPSKPLFPACQNGSLVEVRKDGIHWRVVSDQSMLCAFRTKAEAVKAAREIASEGGYLIIHPASGSNATETYTLGEKAAVRLNALEGVVLNQTSRRWVRDMAKLKLSPHEHRREVLRRFKGKT